LIPGAADAARIKILKSHRYCDGTPLAEESLRGVRTYLPPVELRIELETMSWVSSMH
jgi:hypothetical protein